jgi:hypothetical protein
MRLRRCSSSTWALSFFWQAAVVKVMFSRWHQAYRSVDELGAVVAVQPRRVRRALADVVMAVPTCFYYPRRRRSTHVVATSTAQRV